ncbi:hypothetical protein WDW86_19430 [Bdellovibrionota bacterium FG-2]
MIALTQSGFQRTLLILFMLSQSACSLLLGNIKPIEEKSKNYEIQDLAHENSDWVQIQSDNTAEANTIGISDAAYQSKTDASIISVNSSCREQHSSNTMGDLKSFSNPLFFGVSHITLRDEEEITILKGPALQTTIRGKLGGKEMMLRAVVLQRRACIYDLMLIARPEYFAKGEAAFAHFVASLKIKE